MSLIIATGSNLGDSVTTLNTAKKRLSLDFELIASSRIYTSKAVDYLNQPDFFNQVLEFQKPTWSARETMDHLLSIEIEFGRNREIHKGPRTLDLDIIFWGLETYQGPDLIIPHLKWMERSFVVKPLRELPFFETVEKCFTIPNNFDVDAFPIV